MAINVGRLERVWKKSGSSLDN